MPNFLGKKFQEIVYSFNTNDRYADYKTSDKLKSPTFRSGAKPDLEPIITSSSSLKKNNRFSAMMSPGSGLTSPILESPFNSPTVSMTGDFNIKNEGVSETILAWRHIELWLNKRHQDLAETLSPPATRNDISKVEDDLSVELPSSVITSLRIHDGQERAGSYKYYCGLIFTYELMPLDKVVEMCNHWRNVANKMNTSAALHEQLNKDVSKDLRSPEISYENDFHSYSVNNKSASAIRSVSGNHTRIHYSTLDTKNYDIDPNLEKSLSRPTVGYDVSDASMSKIGSQVQSCIPPNTIHNTYAHSQWIPMVTDNSGNYIAVDLSPAIKGIYGQVILFGRDFDIKYVISPTWGDFLLQFANDLESGNYIISNDDVDDIMANDGELGFYDKKLRRELNYFDVLKKRSIDNWKKLSGRNKNTVINHDTIEHIDPDETLQSNLSMSFTYENPELQNRSASNNASDIIGVENHSILIGSKTEILNNVKPTKSAGSESLTDFSEVSDSEKNEPQLKAVQSIPSVDGMGMSSLITVAEDESLNANDMVKEVSTTTVTMDPTGKDLSLSRTNGSVGTKQSELSEKFDSIAL